MGIGWALPWQGRKWFDSAYYQEIEAPLDSCWMLDAMVGDGGRTIGFVHLMRPRSARPFTVDDVHRLDRLRPWLAHALRPQPPDVSGPGGQTAMAAAGAPARSGQMILNADGRLVVQTPSLEFLLSILAGKFANYLRPLPGRDRLPAPILKLLRRIAGAANGTSNTASDAGFDRLWRSRARSAMARASGHTPGRRRQGSEKLSHSGDDRTARVPIAHAARTLRESGATPAQVKVGIQLAFGRTKPVIADELGIQISSVVDVTKRLYQTLDVHNPAELSTKIWLGQKQDEWRARAED